MNTRTLLPAGVKGHGTIVYVLTEEQRMLLRSVQTLSNMISRHILHENNTLDSMNQYIGNVLALGRYDDEQRKGLSLIRIWYISNKRAFKLSKYDNSINIQM